MRAWLIVLVVMVLSPVVLAHDDVDHESEEEAAAQYFGINPYGYYVEGNWISGTVAAALWLLVLKGLYDLTVIIIGRAVIRT